MGLAFDAAVQLAISSVMLGFLRERGAVVCVKKGVGRRTTWEGDGARSRSRKADLEERSRNDSCKPEKIKNELGRSGFEQMVRFRRQSSVSVFETLRKQR